MTRPCRGCGLTDGEHRFGCILAPEPPERYEREADPTELGWAEDQLVAQATGEPRTP